MLVITKWDHRNQLDPRGYKVCLSFRVFLCLRLWWSTQEGTATGSASWSSHSGCYPWTAQWFLRVQGAQTTHGFVWKCWVNLPNYSHLIGIMISKTIGFWGTLFSDTPTWPKKHGMGYTWDTPRQKTVGSLEPFNCLRDPKSLFFLTSRVSSSQAVVFVPSFLRTW